MNRSFWFAAGAGAGIYASFRARRLADAFTSDGVSDRLAALRHGGRILREDIVSAAGEREAQLRDRIGLDAPHLALGATPDQARLLATPDRQEDKELS